MNIMPDVVDAQHRLQFLGRDVMLPSVMARVTRALHMIRNTGEDMEATCSSHAEAGLKLGRERTSKGGGRWTQPTCARGRAAIFPGARAGALRLDRRTGSEARTNPPNVVHESLVLKGCASFEGHACPEVC